jgi:hypothetical protein
MFGAPGPQQDLHRPRGGLPAPGEAPACGCLFPLSRNRMIRAGRPGRLAPVAGPACRAGVVGPAGAARHRARPADATEHQLTDDATRARLTARVPAAVCDLPPKE